jgi:hypothetical protein
MLLCGVEHTAELLSASRDEGLREIKEYLNSNVLGNAELCVKIL